MTEIGPSVAGPPRSAAAQRTPVLRSPRLRAIADDYDLILCDVFGVLHDATGVFARAVEALMRFRERGGVVALISNSALPHAPLEEALEAKGVRRAAWDCAVSSADVARDILRERGTRAAAHIGAERDRVLFQGLGIDLVCPEEAEIIVCTGFPEVSGAEGRILAAGLDRRLDMICTNPDRILEQNGKTLRFAGLIADRYAGQGGRLLWTGKPDPSIYAAALDRAAAGDGRRFDPTRVLAIGDTPALDIAGGLAQGFDAVWITGTLGRPTPRELGQGDRALASSLGTTQSLRWMEGLAW